MADSREPLQEGSGDPKNASFSDCFGRKYLASTSSQKSCARSATLKTCTGYALIELMIALLLISILVVSAFGAFQAVQIWWQNLEQMVTRDENLQTAPLLLARWIAPAGANRHTFSWIGAAIEDSVLELRADFDGPSGFPNGQLMESFERVTIRLKDDELQIRSGNGSFQPFLKDITEFKPEAESSSQLIVRLEATTPEPLAGLQEFDTRTLTFRISLPNYFENLFPEQLP